MSRDAHQPLLPWPLLMMIGGVAAYALAVYWSSRHPSAFTLLLAAFPFAWVAVATALQGRKSRASLLRRAASVLPLLLLLAALLLAWDTLLTHFRLMYLVEHVGIHAGLCWVFARSLRAGRVPLCTEMAGWVHEDMSSPRLLGYTRHVTKVWAVFFAGMAMASVAIYLSFEPNQWTAFSAVIGPLLTGTLFLMENATRSLYLPPKDRVGLAGTWRAVRARLDAQARASERAP